MLDFGADFAKSIAESSHIIELVGDVGAGKTTFVRGLATGLGIAAPVTSPSFTISKSYALPSGKGNLVHYDFYRLSDPGLMSEDLAENLANPDNIVVIEWGESVSNLLPSNHVVILINKTNTESRMIKLLNNRNIAFRDRPRLTRSGLSEARPVTTGERERVEKGNIRLFLDTSKAETVLMLNDKKYTHTFGHDLAEQLLAWIHDRLTENHATWQDIAEIEFMSGPGSYTGLRIGASIVNTLSHELHIPLKDHHGQTHPIIIPDYGRPAHITPPRK